MKRAGADFPIRQSRPFMIQESGHIPTDASDAASGPPAELTIEALRQLPLPPFPEDVDVTTCDEVERIAREGFENCRSDTDLPMLLRFCTKHACADALLWFLLQSDDIPFEPRRANLDPQHLRYLIACLNRLPELVRFSFGFEWSERCWNAFVDALPSSRCIRELVAWHHPLSEQELAHLFAPIEDHPVLCELSVGLSVSTATALNTYLARTSTLRELKIVHHNGKDVALAPDLGPGLLSNRSLTRIELCNWLITPTMAHALAAPGKALIQIYLAHCNFAPGAVAAFADALASNHTMSSVSIELLHGTVSDLKPIYSVLQSNRSLVSLQISGDGQPFTDMAFLWKMLQVNLTLYAFHFDSEPRAPRPNEDPHPWSLLPHVRQRLTENEELRLLANQYPMAKLALSTLPCNLPHLPPEVSANIARLLLKTDASALPSYRTLHMLALHKEIMSQHKPVFPGDVDLASHPDAQRLAQSGKQALPLSPSVMRSIALFCIHHQATNALNWLVVHACKGQLDLQGSQFEQGKAGWLIYWTRAAPCPVKLRLDAVALTKQDVADIAQHLTGNQALTVLSLKGCHLSTAKLEILSEALMCNTALCELLLSEGLTDSTTRSPVLAPWVAFPPGRLRSHVFSPRDVGPLATIAFALRRNNRLHNGDRTTAALLADEALMVNTVNPVRN